MVSSSPVLYHHCSCPATKSSESMETKRAFLESTINKAIHLIAEGLKGEFSSKADTHEENNTPTQGNAVQTSKKNASKRVQAQWEMCLDERRRKYKQYIVSKSLGNKQNATCSYDVREKDNERSSGTNVANREKEIQAFPGKVAKRQDEQAESKLDVKLGDNKTSYEPRINASENSNQGNSQQQDHTWKRGTVLIMGNSMLYGVDEKKLSKNGTVKVRCFSGSTIKDLHQFYIKPLLAKKPSKVILHFGTNDAVNKEATADKILDALLDLKKYRNNIT